MEIKEFVKRTLDEIAEAMEESKAVFAQKEIVVRFELDVVEQGQNVDVVHGGAIGIGSLKFERHINEGSISSEAKAHRITYEVAILPTARKTEWGEPLRSRPMRRI